MGQGELRGFVKSSDYSNRVPSWEELDRPAKIQRTIDLMISPTFVRKGGRASGEEALLINLKKEPELAKEIAATPEGRSAVVHFITTLYRSENAGHSSQAADVARKLFPFEMTQEEQRTIREAELDCRAYALGKRAGDEEEWLQGLTETEKDRVRQQAKQYDLYR